MKITLTMFAVMIAFAGSAQAKWTIDVQNGLRCGSGSQVPNNECQPVPTSGQVCCKVYSSFVAPSGLNPTIGNTTAVKPIVGLKK